MKSFFADNIITGLEKNMQEYSHPIIFDNPFGIIDDDSCSCSLIKVKGSRKDTDYCQERGLSSEQHLIDYQQDLFSLNSQEDPVQDLIQKIRGARIEQQERINCYLRQLDIKPYQIKIGSSIRSQKKCSKLKKIKKSRR